MLNAKQLITGINNTSACARNITKTAGVYNIVTKEWVKVSSLNQRWNNLPENCYKVNWGYTDGILDVR